MAELGYRPGAPQNAKGGRGYGNGVGERVNVARESEGCVTGRAPAQ